MEELSQHSRRYLNTVEGEPVIEAHGDGSETFYVRLPHMQIFPDDLIELIADRHATLHYGNGGPGTRADLIWSRRQFLPSGILHCSGCGRAMVLSSETYGCRSFSRGFECADPNFVAHKSIDRVIVAALQQALAGEWEGAGEKYGVFRLRLASKDPEKPEKRREELNAQLHRARTELDTKIDAISEMSDKTVIAAVEKRLAAILAHIEDLESEINALDMPAKSNALDNAELKLMALKEAFGWLEAKLPLRPTDEKTRAYFDTICAIVPMVRLERVRNRRFIAHVTIQPDGFFENRDKDLTFELPVSFENDPVARTSSKRTGERSAWAGELMSKYDYTFTQEEVEALAQLAPVRRHYKPGSSLTLARMLPCFYFSATNDFTFAEALIAAGIPKHTYSYRQAMSVRNDIEVQLLLDAIHELRPSHGEMHLYKRQARIHLTPREILEAIDHPVLKLSAFASERRNAPVVPSIQSIDEASGLTVVGGKMKGKPRAYHILQSFVTAIRMNVSLAEVCGQHDNRCTQDLKRYMERGAADELVRLLANLEGVSWANDVPSLWQTLYVDQEKDQHRQRAGVKQKLLARGNASI